MPADLVERELVDTQSARAESPEGGRRLPTMLIVDDEEQILKSLVRLFGKRFRVLTALGGAQAIELLKANQVAVIVSDQRMPGMTGAEFLAEAASLQPLASRILLSAYAEIEAVIQAVNVGRVFAYAAKPWRNAELEAVVSSALEHFEVQLDRLRLIDELRLANAQLERRVVERTGDLEQKTRELHEALEKLSAQARTDALTGAANRRMFDEVFDKEVRRAARLKFPLSAILLDLDHFKSINDSHGHTTGDAVLVEVARALASSVRAYDLVARYGGEEFVVLLPQADLQQAESVAERLRRVVGTTSTPGYAKRVTASLGVACLMPGEPPEQLLVHADQALYAAKQGGRDRVEAFGDRSTA